MELRRHAQISPTNKGPYIVVTSYILMPIMILCALLKLRPSRKTIIQRPRLDELVLILAMAVAIAENAIIQQAVEHGFAETGPILDAAEVVTAKKMIYIAKILFSVSMNLGRISILLFISLLAIEEWAVNLNKVITVVVGLWAIAAPFAHAFQCQLPAPWDPSPGECVDQRALNYFDIIFGILIDLFTFALPIVLVWGVQMSQHRKLIIVTAFSTRLILCLMEIFQIATLSYPDTARTYSGNDYDAVLWTQIVLNLSIITASIPALKPLFSKLQSGLMNPALRSASLSSTVNTWNKRMQSGVHLSQASSRQPERRRPSGYTQQLEDITLSTVGESRDPDVTSGQT